MAELLLISYYILTLISNGNICIFLLCINLYLNMFMYFRTLVYYCFDIVIYNYLHMVSILNVLYYCYIYSKLIISFIYIPLKFI
jgi:hypothetical protein